MTAALFGLIGSKKKQEEMRPVVLPPAYHKEEPKEERVLVSWRAPGRPFKRRDKEYYTTIGAIVVLVAIILLFLKEWLLIAVMIALAFVAYVLASVPPEETKHELTNRGVRTGNKLYKWQELWRFWLEEKWKQKMLVVETRVRFPRRLLLMLGEADEELVKRTLKEYLILEKPEPTFMDKASDWLVEKVPLESES